VRKKKNKESVLQRRATYRMYPTRAQEKTLFAWLDLHRELYNAAIEERREAWKLHKTTIQYQDQQNQLPELKELRPELVPLGSHALQETCRRVQRAYDAFFRRLNDGETPGFPRFKSQDRYYGWTWPDPAGWDLRTSKTGRKAVLDVPTLGEIKLRGKAGYAGRPVTCTVTRRRGIWEASIVMEMPKPGVEERPLRRGGSETLAFDWGIETFATVSDGDKIENPRPLKHALESLAKAQRELARKKKGSRRRGKAKAAVRRIYRDVSHQRKEFLHQESAKLVKRAAFLATEKLDTKKMVESERAGSTLRRSILDGSPATFLAMCRYKAEEAGIRYVEVETREAKPSQRCPKCFELCGKKELWERRHECPRCGEDAPRDLAAAKVILEWAQGRRPSGPERAEDRGGKGKPFPKKRETACLARSASVR
jgi:putative transposase